jgi:hypothetical protein
MEFFGKNTTRKLAYVLKELDLKQYAIQAREDFIIQIPNNMLSLTLSSNYSLYKVRRIHIFTSAYEL